MSAPRRAAGRPVVSSVTGEVPLGALGITLCHEHLYCDISVHSGRRDNILTDPDLMAQELRAYGGRGFDYLFSSFLPRLRSHGVTEGQIREMLVEGPREFLTPTVHAQGRALQCG